MVVPLGSTSYTLDIFGKSQKGIIFWMNTGNKNPMEIKLANCSAVFWEQLKIWSVYHFAFTVLDKKSPQIFI